MSRALESLLKKITDPAKRAAVEAELKSVDGLIGELDSGYMRQDDYSSKLDAATRDREAWEAEKKVIEENWVKAKEAYDELVADYQTTAAERKEAREKLEALDKEYKEHKAKNPPIDPSKYVTADQLKEQQAIMASGQAGFFREAMSAQYEIETLTKTRINPAEIVDGAIQSKKTPMEFAEEKWKLSDLRKKDAEEKQKAHDAQVAKEAEEKVHAIYANPQTRPLQDSKDPFIQKAPDGAAKQPWEMTDTPEDEKAFVRELSKAHVQ